MGRKTEKIETATKFQVKRFFYCLLFLSLSLFLFIDLFLSMNLTLFPFLYLYRFVRLSIMVLLYFFPSLNVSFIFSYDQFYLSLFDCLFFFLSLIMSLFLSFKKDSCGVCPQKALKLYLVRPCQTMYTYASSGKVGWKVGDQLQFLQFCTMS